MSENKVLSAVQEQVYELISTGLKIEKEKVHLQSRFIDDLGADSLDQVELVMALEEAFELDIPEDDAEKFACVNDIIEYIELKKTVN